jgi:hypothetical protein
VKGVNDFLSDDDVGGDVPVLNKISLGIVNKIGKVQFEMTSKRFSNNFVNDIAQTDRPKVLRNSGLNFLRN